MDRKMFFLDMDGTTLRDDKSIPEENIEAIQAALALGNFITIATGRTYVSMQPLIRKLGMQREGCFLIACNGALLYDLKTGEILYERNLPDAYAAYLFAEAEKYDLYMQSFDGSGFLARQVCPEAELYTRTSFLNYRIVPDLCHLEKYNTPKVMLISVDDRAALQKFQDDHRAWENGRCISFFTSPQYLEYCPAGCTKASGIPFFEQRFGIAHENTIAVGDEENDLPMIQAAGIGIAMKNAGENIRKYADEVTERDNNHGGVADVIRRYM
ncbi:MAG: Cof-type HAD-IIB family hydrolase [Clostridiales bacterium]|nr:Cof-type HAD-IIB family hydrolase [Clostridiales bacterium]